MARSNRSKNNNPEGRNQYSGWMDSARDRPFTAAATAAAAVGAGVFLWSRRNQISDQISNLSEQFSDWSSSMRSGDGAAQEDFSEEALTLKETGKKSKGPRGPIAQQDFQAGRAGSNQEMKAGAKTFA